MNDITEEKKRELENELASLDKKLKTPDRTERDLIRHMEILKQLKGI